MIRTLRDLIVTFAGPMPPGLPGAGWRIWLLTSAPTILAAVWANYGSSAATIDSSR